MNLKKAIVLGILHITIVYILGFIEIFTLGNAVISTTIVTLILVIFFSLYYFKDKKVKANKKEGFLFGIILIIVGIIFDLTTLLVIKLTTNLNGNLNYISKPLFWVIIFLIIVPPTFIGWIKEKN